MFFIQNQPIYIIIDLIDKWTHHAWSHRKRYAKIE